MVVSEINDRLSPKNAPPTTTAVSRAVFDPVERAMPAAMGVRATMVPTLVPMEIEMKHEAMNSPASIMLPGRSDRVRFTVESMLPMSLAEEAKAPAITKIHSISIRLPVLAPRVKCEMRSFRVAPVVVVMAYTLAIRNATVSGIL